MVYGTRFNPGGGGVLGLIFPSYVPLASQSPYPIIVIGSCYSLFCDQL